MTRTIAAVCKASEHVEKSQSPLYDRLVAELLPRFFRFQQRIEDEKAVARAILEAGEDEAPALRAGATAGGDRRRARGVPIVGPGIGGTAPGTDPLAALIAKENRRRRH